MKTRFSMAALAGALLLPALGAQAQTAAESDNWKFSVMPYCGYRRSTANSTSARRR